MESGNRTLVNGSAEGQQNGQIISRGEDFDAMISDEYNKLKRTRQEARLEEQLEDYDAMAIDEVAHNECENQNDNDVIVVGVPQPVSLPGVSTDNC
jgi:hypothetical protein